MLCAGAEETSGSEKEMCGFQGLQAQEKWIGIVRPTTWSPIQAWERLWKISCILFTELLNFYKSLMF